MNIHFRSLILGLALSFAFILGCVAATVSNPVSPVQATAPGASGAQPAWQYHCTGDASQKSMNELGRVGWELTTASAAGAGTGLGKEWTYQWCFKRPL